MALPATGTAPRGEAMPSNLGTTLLIANPAAQRGNGAQAAKIVYSVLKELQG